MDAPPATRDAAWKRGGSVVPQLAVMAANALLTLVAQAAFVIVLYRGLSQLN